jgi:hypothetical protein
MTKTKFQPDKERYRLTKMFKRLRQVVENQLNILETQPEKATAAMIDTCLRALKGLPSILLDLEKMEQTSRMKQEAAKIREEVRTKLPSMEVVSPASAADPELEVVDPDFPEEAMALPFPKLKGGHVDVTA